MSLAPRAIALLLIPYMFAAASQPPTDKSWKPSRLSRREVRADRELAEIQKRIDRGDLPKVRFDFDSNRINPESYSTLDLIADLLLRNPELKLRITAHTCSIGGEAYNQELSERRASAVKTYLAEQGLPPPSMQSRGWGLKHPIADNATKEGREQNRRVEFSLVQDSWESVY